MFDNELIDQFLTHWQSINRHLRKGALTEADEGITRLQWILLRHVYRVEMSTIGDLAEKFGVRPSTVSQMADRLEKSDLIRRISDTHDARIKFVSLTAKGQALIQNVESIWAKRLTDGLGEFSADEQENLLKLLERLASSLADSK
ncbi:MAG: MarR family transcriptional regulator [Desulfosporosinus sp.]|nr:MarR family transcriptional regulator [Desulfosporosinus sp.]